MKLDIKISQQATLYNWSIVLFPDIYDSIDAPETVFATLTCGHPVALFGQARNDARYNAKKSDAFAEGHRLVTTPIIAFRGGQYHTKNTIYSVSQNDINPAYKKWCEENQHEAMSLDSIWEVNE
jgi:hypothetical protein